MSFTKIAAAGISSAGSFILQNVNSSGVSTFGKTLGIDYGRLSAVLVEAIKELKDKNDSLMERISLLEEKITLLENQ